MTPGACPGEAGAISAERARRPWPRSAPDGRGAADAPRRPCRRNGDSGTIQVLRLGLRAWQAPILGGDTGLDALIVAGETAATAVEVASDATETAAAATGTALAATGRAVGRAPKKTGAGLARFLGLRSRRDHREPARVPLRQIAM